MIFISFYLFYQVIADNNLLILYTGWPGCTHDARVLRNSAIFTEAEEGNLFGPNKHIIADSAYSVKTWLIPPFKDNGHLTRQQRRFNTALSSVRSVVERCFGHLKGRFRRLRELTVYDPTYMVSDIVCGCILHNLTIMNDDEIELFMERVGDDDDDDANPNHYQNIFPNDNQGLARREEMMRALV